ncbi:DUF4872 domain-containing protein [Marinomonas primoryensis]|uniref:DUF4872 domain-containing protein n=1 Tax=Marinomonas primoryensis TaxID=178399 RepID=UPI0030D8473F
MGSPSQVPPNSIAIFRNMYRDFLKEAYELTKLAPISDAYEQFVEIAELWTDVASLLDRAGKHNDECLVNKASDILVELSSKEYLAIKTLEKIA